MQRSETNDPRSDDAFERGLAMQEALFGEGFESRRSFGLQRRFPNWHRTTIGTVFGDVWSRSDLIPLKTRSLVTLAALVAEGRDEQLRVHLRGALHVGWAYEELAEVLMHLAFYVGWPKAMSAFIILDDLLDESDDGHRD